jgi:hypothetical protein
MNTATKTNPTIDLCYCPTCDARTKWAPIRDGRRCKCVGCGRIFPCYGSCQHLDCALERKEKAIK